MLREVEEPLLLLVLVVVSPLASWSLSSSFSSSMIGSTADDRFLKLLLPPIPILLLSLSRSELSRSDDDFDFFDVFDGDIDDTIPLHIDELVVDRSLLILR